MARIAPLHAHILASKRANRASLRHLGVPDGHDVLAVYFWWIRQRYYRAQVEMGTRFEIASSVRSVVGADEESEPISPVNPIAYERKRSAMDRQFDLLGVGNQFDEL